MYLGNIMHVNKKIKITIIKQNDLHFTVLILKMYILKMCNNLTH